MNDPYKELRMDIYILADCIKDLSYMLSGEDEFTKERLKTVFERARNVQERF